MMNNHCLEFSEVFPESSANPSDKTCHMANSEKEYPGTVKVSSPWSKWLHFSVQFVG